MHLNDSRHLPTAQCEIVPPLKARWSIQQNSSVATLPLALDNIIFVREKNNTLTAQERDSHKTVWRYNAKGVAKIIHEQVIYFATDEGPMDLIDAGSGATLQRYPCSFMGPITFVGALLVGRPADGSTALVAYDANSGTEFWRHDLPQDAVFATMKSCTNGTLVFFGEAALDDREGGRMVALEACSGQLVWEHKVSDLPLRMPGEPDRAAAPFGTPVVNGESIIVTVSKDHVLGLSVNTGERRWTWTSTLRNAVAAGAGRLYAGRYYQTGAAGSYHIIDPTAGTTIFEALLNDRLPKKLASVWGWSPLLISETHVFVGSNDGHILAFARDSAKYAWSCFPKPGFPGSSFECGHRKLYYTDRGGQLHCFQSS